MTNKEIREKIWNCFKGYQQEYISESNIDQIMQIVEEEVLEERESKCSKNCMHMPDCPNYNRTPVLC